MTQHVLLLLLLMMMMMIMMIIIVIIIRITNKVIILQSITVKGTMYTKLTQVAEMKQV